MKKYSIPLAVLFGSAVVVGAVGAAQSSQDEWLRRAQLGQFAQPPKTGKRSKPQRGAKARSRFIRSPRA